MLNATCVYVVDDDQAVRDSLQWLLESAGLPAKNYETAAAFLKEAGGELLSTIACVIVDSHLPGMTGIELQQRLHWLGIPTPVIIITGYGQVSEAVEAIKAGAVDYLEKPFAEQTLIQRIRQTLARESHRQALAAPQVRKAPVGTLAGRQPPSAASACDQAAVKS